MPTVAVCRVCGRQFPPPLSGRDICLSCLVQSRAKQSSGVAGRRPGAGRDTMVEERRAGPSDRRMGPPDRRVADKGRKPDRRSGLADRRLGPRDRRAA